jgi:hypothetical protein
MLSALKVFLQIAKLKSCLENQRFEQGHHYWFQSLGLMPKSFKGKQVVLKVTEAKCITSGSIGSQFSPRLIPLRQPRILLGEEHVVKVREFLEELVNLLEEFLSEWLLVLRVHSLKVYPVSYSL